MGNLVSICSIMTCIVTVSTFFFARLTDAKKEGETLGKLTGIEESLQEIKDSIKDLNTWKQETTLQIMHHEEKISKLQELIAETKQSLNEIKSKIA